MVETSKIDGVAVTPLRQIADERGKVMRMLRADSPGFERLGVRLDPFSPGIPYDWAIGHG